MRTVIVWELCSCGNCVRVGTVLHFVSDSDLGLIDGLSRVTDLTGRD